MSVTRGMTLAVLYMAVSSLGGSSFAFCAVSLYFRSKISKNTVFYDLKQLDFKKGGKKTRICLFLFAPLVIMDVI